MAISVGTFAAPDVGVVETTDNVLAALAGAPDVEVVVPVPPAAWLGPEVRRASVVPTAATARITTTKESIHRER
jgi:hypothetical protein